MELRDTVILVVLLRMLFFYGKMLRDMAEAHVGHLYPSIQKPKEYGGGDAKVLAWIWTRTVKCPNPKCGCPMPLATSFILSKKKGKEAYVKPFFDEVNNEIRYEVHNDSLQPPLPPKTGRGANFKCMACGEFVAANYIKEEASSHRIGVKLMAVVAEGKNGRIYLSPDKIQEQAANIEKPTDYPTGTIGDDRRALWTPLYGLDTFDSLFTNRQLNTLCTFSNLIPKIQEEIEKQAIIRGMVDDNIPLREGGKGARAYGEAVSIYLAFLIDKLADLCNSLNRWEPIAQCPRQLFNRQGIPMIWDFAEGNPFGNSSGSWNVLLRNFMGSVKSGAFSFERDIVGSAEQWDAQVDCGKRNVVISTDPPYYDNIGYSDLSDFFYVWLKESLKDTYPDLFATILTPKSNELIASPYRHNGSSASAKVFFEQGMLDTCKQLYKYSGDNAPVSIYYAYKQNSNNSKDSSSGWETMLSAIIKSGFRITGTWPMNTECVSRSVSQGTNALASSIVLVCRKRTVDAPVTTRRNMINTMRREMRTALQKLQSSNIAPVDMAQSAIGPGMAVFSRYSQVLEADGTPMSVRSALAIINEELDAYFNEQVGSMDSASRFCVDLYTQLGYNQIKYGEAEVLANAKGISIPALEKRGILYAKAGVLHLYERGELPTDVDAQESNIWLLTQQLTHIMSKDGIMGCAKAIVDIVGTNIENARDLAYRLYDLAEKKKWSEEAYAYNSLVVAWPDIQSAAAEMRRSRPQQQSLF